MSETTAKNVLEMINNARVNGDFDLVKRLSKRELENPESDIDPLDIMNEIAHMYLDSCLIWVNEMRKKANEMRKWSADPNKQDALGSICTIGKQFEEQPNLQPGYTKYIRKMIDAAPEEVRNVFLSVDADMEKSKKARKDDRGIL